MKSLRLAMDEDLSDPKIMKRIVDDFNQSTLDPVGPEGEQDQQMRIPGEMNELARGQEQLIRKDVPSTDVL